ncbi:MAG: TPM domain-containing protein [bacterium]|nr:TPM domain-containing protein [bacterium]
MQFSRLILLVLTLCLLTHRAEAMHAFSPYYKSISQVIDNGNLLTDRVRAELLELADDTEFATGRQVVIVVMPTLGKWEAKMYAQYTAQQLGVATTKPGVLVLVSKQEGAVAFSLAPGVEQYMTPAIIKDILKSHMRPNLKTGDVAQALRNGMRGVSDALKGEYLTATEKRNRYLPFLILFPIMILLKVFFGDGNADRIFGGGAFKRW